MRKKSAGEYELVIGKQALPFGQEPAMLASRLRGWAKFLFRDLIPAARALTNKRTPAKLRPLMLQKTLEVADNLDQLALRKAIFSLSGKLQTLDGSFELREDGAQLGELSPVGQLIDGARTTVVYPPEVATGKPLIARP